MKYSNMVPVQDTIPQYCRRPTRLRFRLAQCSTGTSPLATAT